MLWPSSLHHLSTHTAVSLPRHPDDVTMLASDQGDDDVTVHSMILLTRAASKLTISDNAP